MEHTCGRCGEVFEELVDGGCPGCGRKIAGGNAPAARALPERTYSHEGGKRTWQLVAIVGAAVVLCLGVLVYLKVTAVPPPAPAEAPKKKSTLKDWQSVVIPAKFIPGMDALRAQAAKADGAPLEDVVKDIRRVLQAAAPLDARIMLLTALEGTNGKRAASLLSALAAQLAAPLNVEDVDDRRSLDTLTARAVLAAADDPNADARQAAAACLVLVAGFRALAPETVNVVRETCLRLAKDAKPETKDSAEKALKKLTP